MKDFLDWFVGCTASNTFYGVWQWLWGVAEPTISAEVVSSAEENALVAMISLRLLRESIERLEVAVFFVRGHYLTARKNHQECLSQIMTAKQQLTQQNSLEDT